MNAEKCFKCGKQPWVIREADGYWYVGCTVACKSESEWDTRKEIAVAKWNETQEILRSKHGVG